MDCVCETNKKGSFASYSLPVKNSSVFARKNLRKGNYVVTHELKRMDSNASILEK